MIDNDLARLLKITNMIYATDDSDMLIDNVVNDIIDITNCDGGTLYILNDNKLQFKLMITRSLNIKSGSKSGKINLPDVEMKRSNVCAYSVLERKSVNISDVYKSELFDFSGPKNYDKMTNYRTKSIMVIPMVDDKQQILGVIQLLNAQDEKGNIISFSKEKEEIITAIASQTAIKLTNLNYTVEIKELMEKIVKTFSEIIYLRTPYNVSHTGNMQKYAERFINWVWAQEKPPLEITEENAQMFYMSIYLHDVGKVAVPLRVMDKATRLSSKIDKVMTRLDIISLTTKLNSMKENCDFTLKINEIEDVRNLVHEINEKPFLNDEYIEKVNCLKNKFYEDENKNKLPWFLEDEIEDLLIIRGTLTPKEREIMQNHVVMTEQILAKMEFKNEYAKVPVWAANHHEFLDGSGYPKGLKGDELDTMTRLITIIDVFDGLSAVDRPYKKPTSIDKVFEIMHAMENEGKLDADILKLFEMSKVWENKK